MPTYQYACTACGHDFETFQSLSEDSLTDCPECSGRLRKKFNAVGVVFKGSGFYRNDSRGSNSSSESGTSTGTNSGSSSGSSDNSGSGSSDSSGGSSGGSSESSSSGTQTQTSAATN
ncbi:FmdB family zinc ribbon protein [Actinopolyspora sp. H202]|uniref:FmdB family zinc ribbon protein n=1 Tax=Actinopolyspora sp. H202 TaxID=1500456 RepID=UPI003EE442D4